jgi:hypothetical protein
VRLDDAARQRWEIEVGDRAVSEKIVRRVRCGKVRGDQASHDAVRKG